MIETILLILAVALLAAALVRPRQRLMLTRTAAVLLASAVLLLLVYFLGDNAGIRYVWLYSSPALAWHLKVAGLWSGDEGTLLLMSAAAAGGAILLVRRSGWAGPGAVLVAALFTLGALLWNPFAPTPAADLARAPAGLGMNVHLARIWMVVHPPAIFAAYLLLLLPVGAALEALAAGRGEWPAISGRWTRLGWLMLSAGLASGMWWAYEDFSFGQFWHWDPVQTAVWMVWAAATAGLHLVRRNRPDGPFALLHPLIGASTAVLVLLAMAVTRSPHLASSHRYVGESSEPLLLAAAAVLALATLVAALVGRVRLGQRVRDGGANRMARLAALVLLAAAAVGGGALAWAYVAHFQGVPRPEALKPFYQTLARWTPAAELSALQAEYDRWTVDNFALNAWLAPLGVLIGVVGGHMFLPNGRRRRWLATIGASALVLIAWHVNPLSWVFSGDGMTSARTVALLPWLSALALSMLWFAAAATQWGLRAGITAPRRRLAGFFGPVALIHLGVVVALGGLLAATVFDSFGQKMLAWPDDFGREIALPDGWFVTVSLQDEGAAGDGLASPFRAATTVSLRHEDGARHAPSVGTAIFRDAKPPDTVSGQGSVRQMCEIVDYRYTRFSAGKARMIMPFIERGLWRDVQVWVGGLEYDRLTGGALSDRRVPSEVPLVVKVFPLVSWLWLGLGLVMIGALAATSAAWGTSPVGKPLGRSTQSAGIPVQ